MKRVARDDEAYEFFDGESVDDDDDEDEFYNLADDLDDLDDDDEGLPPITFSQSKFATKKKTLFPPRLMTLLNRRGPSQAVIEV